MKITHKLLLRRHKAKMIIGGIVAVIIALIWFGQPKSTNSQVEQNGNGNSSSALSLSESAFDFGTVSMAAGKVSHIVTVKNTGAQSITLGKLYTSCMCTVVKMVHAGKQFGPYGMQGHGFIPSMDEVLGAGEEANLEVTFDPAAHGPAGVGRISRIVYLENDAGTPLQIKFKTFVTP